MEVVELHKYEGYNINYDNKIYTVRYINPRKNVWLSPIVYENDDFTVSGGRECCISLKELENIINEMEMVYYI